MTTRRFEGPDLASVLEEVTAELGEGARVIAANRCRSGGVAGFFAKETFEVFVELDAPVAAASTSAYGDDLAVRRVVPHRVEPRTAPREAVMAAAPAMTSHLAALEGLMAAADRVDGPAAAPASRYARFQSTFDETFERAATEEFDPPAFDDEHDFDDWGPDGDRSARPRRRDPKQRRWRRGKGEPAGEADSMTNAGVAEDARMAAPRVIDLRALEPRAVDPRAVEPRAVDSRAVEPRAVDPYLEMVPEHADRAEPTTRPGTVSVEMLAGLGVPRSWMPPRGDAHVRVEDALANLLTPPDIPLARGAVLVFVGQGESLLSSARGLATALRMDPDDCVVVAPDGANLTAPCVHVRTVDELSLLAPAWALLDGVTIVAIDAGFALQDMAWCRQALALLRPVLRWGVVDATRKAEDVRAWARGIGGLHALAVSGVAQTVTPAAILAAEIPVARLDGRIASRELWTKLLDDRINDPARRRLPDLVRS